MVPSTTTAALSTHPRGGAGQRARLSRPPCSGVFSKKCHTKYVKKIKVTGKTHGVAGKRKTPRMGDGGAYGKDTPQIRIRERHPQRRVWARHPVYRCHE